jgi:adenylate cyclase
MALEIKHKFLLKNDHWKTLVSHSHQHKQGYLLSDTKRSLRIRITNNKAWLNIKSATIGAQRQEFEYEIPFIDGKEILETLSEKPILEKTRYFVPISQHTWEIDVFQGANEGLVVVEIELSALNEQFNIPEWIGKEVTHELRFYNNSLCKNPYKNW